jgi:hypothetical protein
MKFSELKQICIDLNKSNLTQGDSPLAKIQYVGKKFEEMATNFADFMEKAAELDFDLPEDAVNAYNELFAEEDEPEEPTAPEEIEYIPEEIDDLEEFKTNAKKAAQRSGGENRHVRRPREPKMDGVVATTCRLIKDDPFITSPEILDILELKFPEKTRKGMYSTVGHCISIVRVFLKLK